jgi:hypothetical protein
MPMPPARKEKSMSATETGQVTGLIGYLLILTGAQIATLHRTDTRHPEEAALR